MTFIFRVAQDNSYIGFSVLVTFAFMFVVYTNNMIDVEDVRYKRDMLKTPEGRWRYYNIIHSQ
jgi:hypothetical protein